MKTMYSGFVQILFFIHLIFKTKTSEHTEDIGTLQKAADFIKAYMLGFAVEVSFILIKNENTKYSNF